MAYAAICSNKGPTHDTNQDAACVLVADTHVGELALVAVCDGVGGLSLGEVASTTVIKRLCSWFREELPAETVYAALDSDPSLNVIESDWRALFARLNARMWSYGKETGHTVGTTLSCALVHGGNFLAAHVGDGRILRVGPATIAQISDDQTLLAHKLRIGVLTSESEALPGDANTILQAVGAQERLNPTFYRGSLGTDDLLVVCCDGAWRCLGNKGICQLFQGVDRRDDRSIRRACNEVANQAILKGETDNITVACLSGAQREWGRDYL